MRSPATCYDYAVIGSGFGGSVSAMRLSEKGYRVVVLERGKRYRDQDFARTNWDLPRYLWMPALRCFGILEMSLLPGRAGDARERCWRGKPGLCQRLDGSRRCAVRRARLAGSRGLENDPGPALRHRAPHARCSDESAPVACRSYAARDRGRTGPGRHLPPDGGRHLLR